MLRVRYAAQITHRFSRAPDCTVQHRIGIFVAQRTCPANLNSYAIIKHSSDWSARYGNAY